MNLKNSAIIFFFFSLFQHSSRNVIPNPQCVRTFKNNWVRKKKSWFQWNLPYINIYYLFCLCQSLNLHTHTQTRVPLPYKPCQCKRHNGQSSCCARSARRRSRRLSAGPSAWAAGTPSAKCAWTSCTVRLVHLTRRPSARTSSNYLSTQPCCSSWEDR